MKKIILTACVLILLILVILGVLFLHNAGFSWNTAIVSISPLVLIVLIPLLLFALHEAKSSNVTVENLSLKPYKRMLIVVVSVLILYIVVQCLIRWHVYGYL